MAAVSFYLVAPPHSAAFLRLNTTHPHLHVTNHHSSHPSTTISSLKSYLQPQLHPILLGLSSSFISVFSLSQIIPKISSLTSILNTPNPTKFHHECLLLGILVLIRQIGVYLQQAFLWEAALNCAFNIRVDVFQKVLERDLGFFEGGEGVNSGDIAYRITAEAADVADTVYHLLNAVGPCLLQLSAMAAQMLAISPALSLISSLVILSVAFINGHLGEKLRKISNRAHLSVATLSAYLNEVLPSILFVKANNAELGERSRFQSLASADLLEHLKKKKMKALIPQIVRVIYFGLLFACFSGSHIVSGGSVDFSATISFITSLVLLIEPIQDAGKAYNEFKQGQPAIERLLGLTKFKPQVHEKPNAVDLELVAGEVIFSGVSFKYREGGPLVLCGLDLHIKAGETIALVGPSGGGKTTLAKLLLRLYDTTHGECFFFQFKFHNRDESTASHFPFLNGKQTIFSGTIAENIGYKDLTTEIDMERVMLAARTANAADFIETLPHQYQTNVGPRGSSLSGGQKQRLAIARALYQNPSILILDEATSALDHRSEQLVRQALQHLMQNRTVLVIAHRLETVLMAERIFCIDDGKLNEVPRSSFLGDQQNSSFFTSLAT
ncbi:hypothetical protein Leryth_006750 [Lithospermum erythrorhizon]|nr:hypothetical protein Leryth_006750 [Lithospermum erythrorhizon]